MGYDKMEQKAGRSKTMYIITQFRAMDTVIKIRILTLSKSVCVTVFVWVEWGAGGG